MTAPSRGNGRIGVLVPFTNTNLEPDMALLCPPGVSMHFARLGGYDLDAYGCTSATLTHGPAFDRDLAARAEALSGAKTVTAAEALVTALTALGVRRIAFASPYVEEINNMAINFLTGSGFETVSRAGVGVALDNYGQGEMTPEAVFELGRRADSAGAEALVLSCTDMRSVETLARLEQALGKPVVSSNQAMILAAMPHLGLTPDIKLP
jgi:maleate isomerase/arylmalonate decarboxylase